MLHEWITAVLLRIKTLLRRRQLDHDLADELEFHLAMRERKLVEQGVTPEEAHYAAKREFGNATAAKETNREMWTFAFLETLLQDLRHGLRQLRRNPGFTAVAVITLALGIGATSAIFSYINAWIIKPLPYPHSERLMVFKTHNTKLGLTTTGLTSTASFLDFEKQQTSFEKVALWAGWDFNLTGNGPPVLMDGGRVSWNFFDVLGAKPLLGRTFTPAEDRAGAGDVAVISEGLWRSRYGGDPKIIGRSIDLGDEAYTVVGVMPAKFQFPLMGVANLWTPLALTDKQRADRGNSFFNAFGVLKAGVTEKQAAAECATIYARLDRQFPSTNKYLTLRVNSMRWEVAREEGAPELTICFVIVAFILLIACANVANLMLARATSRGKEFALRSALGASQGRLARQLLTESLLLFFFGGAAGVLVGILGVGWIDAQIPAHIRGFLVNYGHVDLNLTTLAVTMGIALLCGLAFGLAPAREHSQREVNISLKEAGSRSSGAKAGVRLRRVFVVAEIALAVVVLVTTTLLVKSFVISVRVGPGFNAANVIVAQLALPGTKYSEEWQRRQFGEEVLRRVRALSQVESAGAASSIPFGGFGQAAEVEAVGKPAPQPGQRRVAHFTAVSTNYFSVMQIGLVKGHTFASADSEGSFPSAIIDQTLARDLWPHEDPIGREIRFGEQHTVCRVVGVVNDIKWFNLRQPPDWQMYVPLAQFPSATLSFAVRTASEPMSVAPLVRNAIWSVDRDQPISSVERLATLIGIVDSGYRTVATLLVFFAALAMFLGGIGVYGVMSEQVSRRTHEIGIRIALGAGGPQVVGMILGEGLKLALIGVAMGVAIALGATRLLGAVLYGVAPNDPFTFVAAPVVFTAVALLASYIPARRAAKVDPMVALRHE
ncbi:MAG: ABC transporter permease [Acidobacteriota bacterium]|nr:ABC transporter permease [Acidobacteriota bacterium]